MTRLNQALCLSAATIALTAGGAFAADDKLVCTSTSAYVSKVNKYNANYKWDTVCNLSSNPGAKKGFPSPEWLYDGKNYDSLVSGAKPFKDKVDFAAIAGEYKPTGTFSHTDVDVANAEGSVVRFQSTASVGVGGGSSGSAAAPVTTGIAIDSKLGLPITPTAAPVLVDPRMTVNNIPTPAPTTLPVLNLGKPTLPPTVAPQPTKPVDTKTTTPTPTTVPGRPGSAPTAGPTPSPTRDGGTKPTPAPTSVPTPRCLSVDGCGPVPPTPTTSPTAPSCSFNGRTLRSGQTVIAYKDAYVDMRSGSCMDSAHSETRVCTNGVLSGSFENASCTNGLGPLPTPAPTAAPTPAPSPGTTPTPNTTCPAGTTPKPNANPGITRQFCICDNDPTLIFPAGGTTAQCTLPPPPPTPAPTPAPTSCPSGTVLKGTVCGPANQLDFNDTLKLPASVSCNATRTAKYTNYADGRSVFNGYNWVVNCDGMNVLYDLTALSPAGQASGKVKVTSRKPDSGAAKDTGYTGGNTGFYSTCKAVAKGIANTLSDEDGYLYGLAASPGNYNTNKVDGLGTTTVNIKIYEAGVMIGQGPESCDMKAAMTSFYGSQYYWQGTID